MHTYYADKEGVHGFVCYIYAPVSCTDLWEEICRLFILVARERD